MDQQSGLSILSRRSLIAVTLALLMVGGAYGFDDRVTHPQLTLKAVRTSKLDTSLKTTLGLASGTGTRLQSIEGGNSVADCLIKGAADEDADCRAKSHFHNPWKDFSASGVSDVDGGNLICPNRGYSNVTWGTDFTAPETLGRNETPNLFNWSHARDAYFDALTKEMPSDREAALADTFLKLGYVLHLIQDLAVPAHVRDDFQSHVDCSFMAGPLYCGSPFERYVRNTPGLLDEVMANAQPVSVSFQDRYLTRFWDTGLLRTSQSPLVSLDQGLAEYTNVNFASENTILTETKSPTERYFFRYPNTASTNLRDILVGRAEALKNCVPSGGGQDSGWYLTKEGPGERIEHFAKTGYLFNYVSQTGSPSPPPGLKAYQLDQCVYRDYAVKVLPMAVAYSAGLVDYFFRGKLNFAVEPAKDANGNDDPARKQVTITNLSPETMDATTAEGQFYLYGDVDGGQRVEFPVITADQAKISLAPGATSAAILFTVGNKALGKEIEGYAVAFKGKLGQEEFAVAGAVNPVAGVFGIQETAGFSADPVQTDSGAQETVTPYSHVIARTMRSEGDPARQQATGRFETGGKQRPGKFIKAVRLQMPPYPILPDPGTYELRLRLDDRVHATSVTKENEWIRGEADASFEPDIWTIKVDVSAVGLNGPSVDCGPHLWYTCATVRLPRAIEVEMLDGTKLLTPLVWWSGASENVESATACSVWPDVVCSDANRSSRWYTTRNPGIRVFYGDGDPAGEDYRWVGEDPDYRHAAYPMDDPAFPHTSVGFVPLGSVGNFGVGAVTDEAHITPGNPYPDNGDPWMSGHQCSGTWTKTQARVFGDYGLGGDQKAWAKNTASIMRETGENVVTRQEGGPPACVLPPSPTIDAPVLADLQIKRDYLPKELTVFQGLGIKPPPHTITLKARMDPTP